jgi:hypothetical protein
VLKVGCSVLRGKPDGFYEPTAESFNGAGGPTSALIVSLLTVFPHFILAPFYYFGLKRVSRNRSPLKQTPPKDKHRITQGTEL